MSDDKEYFVCYVLLKLGQQKIIKPDKSSFTVTVNRLQEDDSYFYYTISINNLSISKIIVNNCKLIFTKHSQVMYFINLGKGGAKTRKVLDSDS